MRTVPLPIARELQYGSPVVVDLLEVYASGSRSPDLRFALFDQDVVWNGREYAAAGFKTPLRNRQSISDSLGEMTVILPDLGTTIAGILETADIAGSEVLVRRVLMSRLDGDESVVFYRGKIRSPIVVEGTTVALTLAPLSEDPEDLLVVPGRSYTWECTWRRFGGRECGVDLVPLTYEGEVDPGCGLTILRDPSLTQSVIDSLARKVGVDDNGDDVISALPSAVTFTSGLNDAQTRPVLALRPCVIEVGKPFYSLPREGDTYRLQRRCPRTADACEGYDNLARHGGFSNSPKEPRNLRRELLQ